MIKTVQLPDVPGFPGLVSPAIVNDDGMIADIIQIHFIAALLMKCEQSFGHIIPVGIQRNDPRAVKSADDILIRQKKLSFVGIDIIENRLVVLLHSQLAQID